MWDSIIAVAGTLAGALATGILAQRAARAERAESRAVGNRQARVAAVRELAVALAAHRGAMWLREHARLAGAGDYVALREASHETRSALEGPRVTALLVLPGLVTQIEAAVSATYALRDASSEATLERHRAAALAAADDLLAAANELVGVA